MSRHVRAIVCLVCLILVVLIPALTAAQNAAPRVPLPPEMMPHGPNGADGRVIPDRLPPGPTLGSLPAAPPATREGPHWTRVVFWFFDLPNGNYDLIDINPGDNNIRALTHTPVNEAQPALSPDGTRIAYVADADGDFDLYVAPYDYGTGHIGPAVKLTQNSDNDYWPVWSPDGRRLAFYGFVGEQADVFVINADGTGLANVSHHGAFDGFPTWSPDGARIAFSSYRTGGYRIHVMNADGSNVGQLSHVVGSLYPTWSPDGTKIAFSADPNVDGWLDLMFMDGDGGNLQLIAYSNEGEDRRPRSWSPERLVFAFTWIRYVRSHGDWYIDWTAMQTYALDGEWSDDFTGWGYNFDPYWASIDHKPPPTAVAPLPAVSPSPFTVVWGGADEGPAGLTHYDIQVQLDGGAWADWLTNTQELAAIYEAKGGTRVAFRSRGTDAAGNVEAWPAQPDAVTTVESQPPLSSMSPLAPFSRAGEPIPLHWRGHDVGPSGMGGFQVQFRRGAEGWTIWKADTLETGAPFYAEDFGILPGEQVWFRVRAIDRAQNVEAWPADPGDAATTLYARRVDGRVIDNTGNAVGGATAAVSPAAIAPVAAGPHGRYTAFLTAVPAATLSWTKPGYGALPPLTRATTADLQVNPVLPPADDALDNGDFEAAGWGAWQPGGAISPSLSADTHSGAHAAALGAPAPFFGQPERLTSTANQAENSQQLMIDGQGRAFAVWQTGIISEAQSLYSATRLADGRWTQPRLLRGGVLYFTLTRDAAGKLYLAAGSANALTLWEQAGDDWSAEAVVPGSAAGAVRAKIDAGPAGVLDVTWGGNNGDLFHSRRGPGGWSTPFKLGTFWASFFSSHDLVRTPDGALHAAWSQGDGQLVYRRLAPTGTWGPLTVVVPYGINEFGLRADAAGGLHLLWLFQESYYHSVVAYRSKLGPAWGPMETLWEQPIADGYLKGFEVSPGGVAQALVKGHESLDYLRRETDGRLSITPLPPEGRHAPAFVLDAAGAPHVALNLDDQPGPAGLYYSARSELGEWLDWVNISPAGQSGYDPILALDSQGRAHALYSITSESADGQGHHLADVAYAGPLPLSGGESILSQTVAIPPGMNHPTLSFVYQSAGVLRLSVAGAAATEKQLTPSPAGYRHAWVDLSDYAGETVTVTLQSGQAAAGYAAWAVIDDVTLGAAHTDIAVSGASSARQPDDTVIHTLRVSNPSALAAAGVSLTYTLPPQLTYVAADPAPASVNPLRWQLGALAPGAEVTIRITTAAPPGGPTAVTSVAQIATTDAELELLNNSLDVVTRLEQVGWLPLVVRP